VQPSLARRALSRTIWAPGAIPEDETKYATPLKRVFLPLFDVVCVIAGIAAIHSGIPALDSQLPDLASRIIGYLFMAAALVALYGIATPTAWRIETVGKCILLFILACYFIALRILAGDGDGTRDFVSALVVGFSILPLIRLWILAFEREERKAKTKSGAA
jgi:hypothetical protein